MQTVNKPWGYYQELYRSPTVVMKRLVVLPRQSLSFQYHEHRHEFWVVEQGNPTIYIEDNVFYLEPGQTARIAKLNKHSISNDTDLIVIICETQYGELCSEDDIVRIEDKYGRA